MNCKINKRFNNLTECIKMLSKHTGSFENNSQVKNAIRKYYTGQSIDEKEENATEIDKSKIQHDNNIIRIKLSDISKKATLGRDASNDIVIENDHHVSRNHAFIEKKGSSYYITDNNSQNGIKIDNKKIPKNKSIQINPRMLIFIGQTTLKIL